MINSTSPTLTPAETTFEYITKTVLELEESEIKILAKERCKIMHGLARLTVQVLQDLKFKCIVNKVLMEVIRYIQYHKCKVDHTTWFTFDEDTRLHLSHDTYATSLAPLVNLGPRFPKAVANMEYLSPTTPTHATDVSTYTQILIDNSAVDPKTINVTRFHKGDVLRLAQKYQLHLSTMISLSKVHNTIYVLPIQIKYQ